MVIIHWTVVPTRLVGLLPAAAAERIACRTPNIVFLIANAIGIRENGSAACGANSQFVAETAAIKTRPSTVGRSAGRSAAIRTQSDPENRRHLSRFRRRDDQRASERPPTMDTTATSRTTTVSAARQRDSGAAPHRISSSCSAAAAAAAAAA